MQEFGSEWNAETLKGLDTNAGIWIARRNIRKFEGLKGCKKIGGLKRLRGMQESRVGRNPGKGLFILFV